MIPSESEQTIAGWTKGRALRRAIPALGLTQMIGWGTTYYMPAVLVKRFEADLGLSDTIVFGAVAVMLIVSALVSWPMGRLIDRMGARPIMSIGSVLFAFSLVLLSLTQGLWSYLACWALMGVGMTMALSNAAFAALTQIAGKDSRRAIAMLMIFGGMASTMFWPLTLWLDGMMGWRNICLFYACLHVCLCLPVHWLALLSPAQRLSLATSADADLTGSLPSPMRRKAAALMVIASAGNGFVSWGLDLHLITVLMDFGLGATAAVAVAALKGPATLMARAVDVFSSGRVTPMGSALAAGVLIPAGLLLAMIFGRASYGPFLFIFVFSFGTGLMTVARATLPLTLLGAVGYATTLGRFALPTQLVYAVSPMVFGIILNKLGVSHAFVIALVAALASLLALLALARLTQVNPSLIEVELRN
jgi:MFS family permease